MKKFIVFVFLFLFSVVVATAAIAEYTVVKNGEKITISKVVYNGGINEDWVTTYEFVNPTFAEVSNIGLPENYWPWLSGKNGVYSTEAAKAEIDLAELRIDYKEKQNQLKKMQNRTSLLGIISCLLSVALVLSVVYATYMQRKK